MERLYYFDHGNDTGVDGTDYVLSGNYYFNCENGTLIRKRALAFPYPELEIDLKVQPEIIVNGAIFTQDEIILHTYLQQPGWGDGLRYWRTALSPFGLLGEVFSKRVLINRQDMLLIILYDPRMPTGKRFSFSMWEYDPSRAYTQEQEIEQARNSCSKPQD